MKRYQEKPHRGDEEITGGIYVRCMACNGSSVWLRSHLDKAGRSVGFSARCMTQGCKNHFTKRSPRVEARR